MENSLVPYQAAPLPTASQILVFAPHPDDEVFGPGGTLALYAMQGTPVQVIVLTDGAVGRTGEEKTRWQRLRQSESVAAAEVLGIAPPIFWDYPDRELAYGESVITLMLAAIQEHAADLVLTTALTEMHPDHRALAMAGVEAVRRLNGTVRLMMYEIGVAMPSPSLLVDITPVLARKTEAMACFPSQLALQRYDEHITALNRFRSYTLRAEVAAAEAFHLWNPALEPLAWRELFQPEYQRQQRLGLPLTGALDVPLVSILIRSMGRDLLAEALDSVALQTYSNIEVVVVNALGEAHPDLPERCGLFPLRRIEKGGRLARAAAANVALASAGGDWCLFLDDDDYLAPDHIARLVAATRQNPDVLAVHTGVACVNSAGEPEGPVFNCAMDPVLLMCGNSLPIHGVLFSRKLRDEGCCFDEKLDLFEDWDFWLQVSEKARFVFVSGVSAYYRLAGESGVQNIQPVYGEAVRIIYRKWRVRWSEERLLELMNRCVVQAEASAQELIELRAAYQEVVELRVAYQELIELRAAYQEKQGALRAMEQSTSWRMTAWLRWLVRHLR